MLVGLHVVTYFRMYRQNSEKALLGGGGGALRSGYASAKRTSRARSPSRPGSRAHFRALAGSSWDLDAL